MKITTVKMKQTTKVALEKIRKSDETFDQVIARLIKESKNTGLKQKLIEGYKQENLKEFKAWEQVSSELEEW